MRSVRTRARGIYGGHGSGYYESFNEFSRLRPQTTFENQQSATDEELDIALLGQLRDMKFMAVLLRPDRAIEDEKTRKVLSAF